MNLVSWTPFRDMEGFFDRYHRLHGNRPIAGAESGKDFDWRPTADISESKDAYLIKAELPEVEKEDVHISIDNGLLTISGERHFQKDEETDTQHRIESMYGRFSRSFSLPADVDEAGISAKSANGVLRVRLPKIAQESSRSIDITVD